MLIPTLKPRENLSGRNTSNKIDKVKPPRPRISADVPYATLGTTSATSYVGIRACKQVVLVLLRYGTTYFVRMQYISNVLADSAHTPEFLLLSTIDCGQGAQWLLSREQLMHS
jgi:hypothetical protein